VNQKLGHYRLCSVTSPNAGYSVEQLFHAMHMKTSNSVLCHSKTVNSHIYTHQS